MKLPQYEGDSPLPVCLYRGLSSLTPKKEQTSNHPHVHALVLAGILKDGVFYEKRPSTRVIAEIFRARLLTVLLEQGVITQELIDMLIAGNHNSGFNVHTRGRISGSDCDAIESVARYMSRAAISIERVEFNPDDILELSKKNCLALFCLTQVYGASCGPYPIPLRITCLLLWCLFQLISRKRKKGKCE